MLTDEVIVTVIVPVYNTEKCIRDAIESVIKQTFNQWELILIDDGSNDESGNICDEYAEKNSRIKSIHKKNGGVSSARNTGIDNAIGKWIVFLDSDDFMEDNMLEKLIFHSDNSDLVECCIMRVPEYKKMGDVIETEYYDSLKESVKDFIKLNNCCFYHSVCNKLYKREKMSMRFNSELSLGEDFCFNLEYMSKCKNICIIPEALYNYRIMTERSLTKRLYPDIVDIEKILYYQMITYMGNNQMVRDYASWICIKGICNQCVILVSNGEFSFWEKKKLIDCWANNDFLCSGVLNISSAQNNKQKLLIQLLKRKHGYVVYLLSWFQFFMGKYKK